VSLALIMGASFVARSFSGDKAQLVPIIKAAIAHPGAAFIDVISPCVAFNNHAGSTKSYEYVREHNEAVNRLDFMPKRDAISVNYNEGDVISVPQHDGSVLRLRKLHPDFDPTDRVGSLNEVARAQAKGEVLTGLLYVNPDAEDLHANLNTVDTAFNRLEAGDLCPGSAMLDRINASLR
jgi:2-oxoglutarate ferredoxin oxidoreductase subunit beta